MLSEVPCFRKVNEKFVRGGAAVAKSVYSSVELGVYLKNLKESAELSQAHRVRAFPVPLSYRLSSLSGDQVIKTEPKL